MQTEFDSAILQISDRIQRTLQFIPCEIKGKCEEIRLRQGLPLCLTVDGRVMFVCTDSTVIKTNSTNCITVSSEDLQQTLSLLCRHSVYLHEDEIKQGFISLPNGCRAGVCGVFNAEGMLITVTSINIRIARQIFGCGQVLLPYAKDGLLIAGPPASGKTTILRDLIRQLSNGKGGEYYRIAVIDSRGEISGGIKVLDLGVNTDVLYMQNKALGTEIALRTMFPNIIAFDEIATQEELDRVLDCFNAGVSIITTAHCNSIEDILRRRVTSNILKSGAISKVAMLSSVIGMPPTVSDIKEFCKNAHD